MVVRIIKIFVSSPSDVSRQKELLMNHLPAIFVRRRYEELCNARIITYDWTSIPSQAGHAQSIINSRLFGEMDIVIAIFRHRLGTPVIDPNTNLERAPSGTAEELILAINRNKLGQKPLAMLYYYEIPPMIRNPEWIRLETFRDQMSCEILHKLYNDNEEEFLWSVCTDISESIRHDALLNIEKNIGHGIWDRYRQIAKQKWNNLIAKVMYLI